MFKNLSVFRFDPHNDRNEGLMKVLQSAEAAAEFYLENAPEDPHTTQIRRIGVAPVDHQIVEQATDVLENKYTFLPITLVVRERAIDNAAVKCMVERKVKEQGRPVGRKEREIFKDEILFSLIPNAPIKEKYLSGYITSDGYILVNAAGKPAEDYVSVVREWVGGILLSFEDEADQTDAVDVHRYCYKKMYEYFNTPTEELKDVNFVTTGSFMFTHGDEKIDIRNCDDETFSEDLDARFCTGHTVWCSLSNDDIEFRLTNAGTLKSIKLGELSYEPTNDEDGHLSAAYHRFYLEFFRNTFNTLMAEIRETSK